MRWPQVIKMTQDHIAISNCFTKICHEIWAKMNQTSSFVFQHRSMLARPYSQLTCVRKAENSRQQTADAEIQHSLSATLCSRSCFACWPYCIECWPSQTLQHQVLSPKSAHPHNYTCGWADCGDKVEKHNQEVTQGVSGLASMNYELTIWGDHKSSRWLKTISPYRTVSPKSAMKSEPKWIRPAASCSSTDPCLQGPTVSWPAWGRPKTLDSRQRMLKFSIRSLPLSALDHVLHVDHIVLNVDHLRPFSIKSCHQSLLIRITTHADEQTVVTRLKNIIKKWHKVFLD